jgi:lipoate-protein ligase A
MNENNVLLSRRKTGGGAVYHDLGNTCFSFLTPYTQSQEYDYKTVNNSILINTFNKLGIPAEVAGRNDLHCEGKKVKFRIIRFQDQLIGCIWGIVRE